MAAETDIAAAEQEDVPTSFAELPVEGADAACRVCGAGATHRMQLVVRPRVSPRQADGRPAGAPKRIADHSQDYCEAHAVALFVKIKKAMR